MTDTLVLCERLEKLYAGVVCDALDDPLNRVAFHRFDYTTPGKVICGPAFNTWGKFINTDKEAKELDPIRIEMLEHFPEGGIQVLDIGISIHEDHHGYRVAHFGDITATTITNAGGKGTITNGKTRDVDLIRELKYPLVHQGVSPVDAVGHWMLAGYGDRIIQYFDLSIAPGDILHVSSDGIVKILPEELEAVCEKAEEIAGKELSVRDDLKELDPMDVYKKHGRW